MRAKNNLSDIGENSPVPKILSNSAKRMHLSEIKRVRRMTPLLGNELATVLIAAICIALLVRVTL